MKKYLDLFALDGAANILDDPHFGVVNGRITTNVLHSNVLSFRTLYAPPFASSNFMLDGRVFGDAVRTKTYSWLPFRVHRRGPVNGVEVSSALTLIEGQRALILEVARVSAHGITSTRKKSFS